MRNTLIKLLLGVISLLSISLNTNAQTNITINPSLSYQTIEGIGGGIVYYLDWLTTHKNKELLYDTIFTGLGITGLRMGNWAQEENADLSYDAEIVNEAKKRLGDNFFLTMSAWSAPANLKANGSLSGSNGGPVKPSLKKEFGSFVYDKYGSWWRRALEQYQAVGVYPDHFSIQNEPDCDADYESTIFDPTESYDIASYSKALNAVYTKIKGMPKQPKILGPEALGIGWEKVQSYINTIDKSQLYGYNFHYYHSGMNDHDARDQRYSYPDDFLGAMTQLSKDYLGKKPMFMTENSSLRDRDKLDPIYMACFMSYAFAVNHVSSYLHWNLIWGDSGDGCINLEFSEKGYKTEDGYKIQGDYHALRHFTKFIGKGWKNISAQTSNNDNVMVSAFKSPQEDAFTVVIINRSKSAQYIKIPFFPEGMRATVIRSVPLEEKWSQVIGSFESLNDMYPPAYSITTIVYRRPAQTLVYEKEGSDVWSTANNWTPNHMPQPNDTTIIRKGEVKSGLLNQTAPMVVEEEGIFRLTDRCKISNLSLKGGTLKIQTTNPSFSLQTDLDVTDSSTIAVGEKNSILELKGNISGNGDIYKTNNGILKVEADATKLNGSWTIKGGTLLANNNNALGPNGVFVDNGTLEIAVDVTTQQITIADSSKLVLKGNLYVKDATIGEKLLSGGTYTTDDFPEIIQGEGSLIVNKPVPMLTKKGEGDAIQSVDKDSAIVEFYYEWENADSISIIWNPSAPEGLIVNTDYVDRTISFSGALTSTGIYYFSITTKSGAPEEARKNGSFNVSESVKSPITKPSNQTINVLATSSDVEISIYSKTKEKGQCMIVDMEGHTMADIPCDLSVGENKISRNLHLPQGTYLLQLRGTCKPKSCQFIVK